MKLFNLGQRSFSALLALAVLAMLGLQGVLEVQWMTPLGAEVTALRQSVRLQKQNAAAQALPVAAPQVRLDAVLTRLAQQPGNPTRIERLHQLASKNGVLLRKVSYQNQKPTGQLLRHEISAEISGSYPGIRQFLRDLMAQDEALALESLEFSRPAGNAGVRAQVRLVLFSRGSVLP